MLHRGFWEELEKPIIGLSPMDGVTDAAFRYMIAKFGSPSLTMTEFTNVEGLARGAEKMLVAFLYNKIERPVIAQIYGVEVDSFYKCTVMLAALGFDGVDINMGCPANKVARKGSGAGLIQTPKLAQEIIHSCKKGAKDWSEGISLEQAGVHPDLIPTIRKMQKTHNLTDANTRNLIPISVKTRIGFDKEVVDTWIPQLLEAKPANISLHGRTLRQMYMGKADWDAIGKAAEICRGSGITLLGNGDVDSLEEAHQRVKDYQVDGVLVGRATFGNPWFFSDFHPNTDDRLDALLEHARYFMELNHISFYNIRKHMAWYCKGFDGARELRKNLMQTNTFADVENTINDFKNGSQQMETNS